MLRKEGYKVRTASTRNNKALRLAEMLGLIAKHKNTTDIVLIDTYGALNFYYAYLVGRACSLLGLEYIPILHGGNLPERLENSNKLSKSLFGNAKANIAPSKFLYNIFKSYGFDNTQIIPNAIRTDKYPFKERHEFRPKLLWVRRFQKRYNPLMAIKVLTNIKAKISLKPVLCMVGLKKMGVWQPVKSWLKNMILKSDLPENLERSIGHNLSRNYDFFINTTSIDNTPISVIEAMSLGLPIISTNVGGMPVLINNGNDGILIEENNDKAMAEEIFKIIEEPEKGHEICKHARKKVESFDWEAIKDKWNRVLDS